VERSEREHQLLHDSLDSVKKHRSLKNNMTLRYFLQPFHHGSSNATPTSSTDTNESSPMPSFPIEGVPSSPEERGKDDEDEGNSEETWHGRRQEEAEVNGTSTSRRVKEDGRGVAASMEEEGGGGGVNEEEEAEKSVA
jgi:hypothetical protein